MIMHSIAGGTGSVFQSALLVNRSSSGCAVALRCKKLRHSCCHAEAVLYSNDVRAFSTQALSARGCSSADTMPVDFEGRFKRILEDIETTSLSIRRSALAYANGSQNFEVSERLRHELETIRISADAILEAITKASVTDYTIDDGLMDWLYSGDLRSCLSKLKEMDTMLKPVDSVVRPIPGLAPARPLRPGEDKLAATMVFFDRNKSLFHFLITPNVW